MGHVTIPDNVPSRVYQVGSTPQQSFPVPFPFFDTADVLVAVDGVQVAATVTAAPVDGGFQSGTVALSFPVANAAVSVWRETPIRRETDFPYPSQIFDIRSLNTELDRFLALLQEFLAMQGRSIRVSTAEAPLPPLPPPATRGGKLLGFGSDGAPALFPLAGQGQPGAPHTGRLYLDSFGANGSGAVSDSDALDLALAELGGWGGMIVVPAGFRILLTRSVTLPFNVCLCADHAPLGSSYFLNTELPAAGGVLLLAAGVTITLATSASLRRLAIQPQSGAFPASEAAIAAWSGTAITFAHDVSDVVLEDLLIIGFAKAIASPADAGSNNRMRLHRINIDCLNGVFLKNALDVSYVDEVHCWPMATQHLFDPVAFNIGVTKRPGYAFRFEGSNDWTRVTRCFQYGYELGYRQQDCDSMLYVACGSDYPANSGNGGVVGFTVQGTAFNTTFLGCSVGGVDVGIEVNTTEPNDPDVTVTSFVSWEASVTGILVRAGRCSVSQAKVGRLNPSPAASGVQVLAAGKAVVSSSTFRNLGAGLGVEAGGKGRLADGNTFIACEHPAVGPGAPSLPSAQPLQPDGEVEVYQVTGTNSFSDIINASSYVGRMLVLRFSAALTVQNGGTVKLKNSVQFVTQPGSILTLITDGAEWYEVSRVA